MYKAINQYLIAEKIEVENKSEGGIILTNPKTSNTYLVVETTEETKELQGKKVIPSKAEPLEGGYFSIDYKDIIAVLA